MKHKTLSPENPGTKGEPSQRSPSASAGGVPANVPSTTSPRLVYYMLKHFKRTHPSSSVCYLLLTLVAGSESRFHFSSPDSLESCPSHFLAVTSSRDGASRALPVGEMKGGSRPLDSVTSFYPFVASLFASCNATPSQSSTFRFRSEGTLVPL